MGPSLDFSIVLIAIAPFLAAVMAPMVVRFAGRHAGWVLAIVPASIFAFLVNFLEPIAAGQFVSAGFAWVPSYGIGFSFFIDGLSLTFALLISGIGTLIIIYSGAYLAGHRHQGRFFGFMLAFMGAMLGLVLADSMVVLFVFWELTSVTSFLLIGFDNARQAARRAAIQALVITNIGGLALLVGVVLIQQLTGTWELSGARGFGEAMGQHPLYGLVLGLVLLAAFTKSAQFPFQFWLTNAMEAPTPVSAYLHSATMVQAGVYLLARMNPLLGGTTAWTVLLVGFGGVTLLWGGVAALRQTDLKRMLAYSTISALGLLVLLIGVGSDYAISAMVVYCVGHAFYKAALFMLVGVIDYQTGTRDITALGGLMRKMPLSFLATALAGISMVGLPLSLGYLAKEEMYRALAGGDAATLLVLIVLILGNALLAAVGLAMALRPFTGAPVETPRRAREASPGLLAGPVVLALLGIAVALGTGWFGDTILVPAASSVRNLAVDNHLTLALDLTQPALWLSILTWALAIGLYLQLDLIRTVLRRFDTGLGWSFDRGFDAAMFGLIRFSGALTRTLHHGRLELYFVVVFVALALVLIVPLMGMNGLEVLFPAADLGVWVVEFSISALLSYEWLVIAIAMAGLVALVIARNRLTAILSLGVQGLAVAMLFLLFGAPDLAFTQFMVEILTVVILTLVMTRLRLEERDRRPFEDGLRDGTIAIACGVGVSLLLMTILTGTLDTRLSDMFAATSVPIAHGHNIVNVILVDYRGFDTLGEIAVVMGAGVAILALLNVPKRASETPRAPGPRRRRKAAGAGA